MTEQALSLLQQAGMVRQQKRPWHSLWIDLDPDEQTLRASLNGKWRNQLKAAEKNGLTLECSSSDSSSEWMLERHGELASIRGFSGPPLEFIRELRASMIREGDAYLVLRALHDGEPVAGISIAQHGTSGTYLLGWNGKKGRKTHANNFLLWNATMVLKKRGCSDMELGGINEWLTPGIAAFKRGMGGREFRLVGEYSS
jgi:lipid II:glycine glycyltransferase (peptidoglycan interpeptide bridge formation enzyme)